MGILDEECLFPKGTDDSLLDKVSSHLLRCSEIASSIKLVQVTLTTKNQIKNYKEAALLSSTMLEV